MVDTQLLENRITDSGLKKSYLADKIGCSIQYLRLKITNKADFKLSEVEIICDELGITKTSDRNRIFFAKNVDKSST